MRPLWLAPALALVFTGCASDDPRSQLRGEVADVTDAANAGDPDDLRAEVDELLSTVRGLVGAQDLPVDEGDRIIALALRVAENADLAAPEPSPEPSPSEEESEEPSPEPEPSEEPSPEPEPSEEPSPEPEPSEEPSPEPEPSEEEEEPILEVSPAAMSPSTAPAESSPSPTAAQSKQQAPTPSPSPS